MDIQKLKEFIQNYLDTVISPKVNSKISEMGMNPYNFSVYEVLKGSYQPPIIHIFLDTEPQIRKTKNLKPWANLMLSGVERDLEDFFKIFSINNKIKVHWNQRPVFKGTETPKPFYGTTDSKQQ